MYMSGKMIEYMRRGRSSRPSRFSALLLGAVASFSSRLLNADEPATKNRPAVTTVANKADDDLRRKIVDGAIDQISKEYCGIGGTNPKNKHCLNCLGLVYAALEKIGVNSQKLSRNGTQMIPQLLGLHGIATYQFKADMTNDKLFLLVLEQEDGKVKETFIENVTKKSLDKNLPPGYVLFLVNPRPNKNENGQLKENPVAIINTQTGKLNRYWIWHTGISSDSLGEMVHASYVPEGNVMHGHVQSEDLTAFVSNLGYSGVIAVKPNFAALRKVK